MTELEQLTAGFLGATESLYDTIAVKTSIDVGIPIGLGSCKAVRLKLNLYPLNDVSEDREPQPVANLYYGDSQQQSVEFFAGEITHLIITDRLEKIFVRNPYPETAYLQIEILR